MASVSPTGPAPTMRTCVSNRLFQGEKGRAGRLIVAKARDCHPAAMVAPMNQASQIAGAKNKPNGSSAAGSSGRLASARQVRYAEQGGAGGDFDRQRDQGPAEPDAGDEGELDVAEAHSLASAQPAIGDAQREKQKEGGGPAQQRFGQAFGDGARRQRGGINQRERQRGRVEFVGDDANGGRR